MDIVITNYKFVFKNPFFVYIWQSVYMYLVDDMRLIMKSLAVTSL